MLADERSEFFLKRFSFYSVKIACSRISGASRFCSLLVFPTRCRYCRAGISASEMPIGGIRDFSGAFVASLNFGGVKDMSGASRRNVLIAGRSSSRNDAIVRLETMLFQGASLQAFRIRMVFFFRADLLYLFQFCRNSFSAMKYNTEEKMFHQNRLVRVIMSGYRDRHYSE